jgi:hypothetical protein
VHLVGIYIIEVEIYLLLKKLNSCIFFSLGTIDSENNVEGGIGSSKNKTNKFTEFGIY